LLIETLSELIPNYSVRQYRQSISVVQQLKQQRMYPLTLKGLEDAMRMLTK